MKKKRKNISAYFYILPIASIIIFFWYIPIVASIGLSFTEYNGLTEPVFNGTTNYRMLFKDEVFLNSIKIVLKFILFVTPIQIILAFFVAAWVDRKAKSKSASFVRGAMIIPALASTSVIGIVCRMMLNNSKSPLNPILKIFGIESTQLLGSESHALITLMVIKVFIELGYYMTLYMASLTDIPRSYYDSALIDGANQWKIYTKITFPLVKNTTLLLMFLSSIGGLKMFGLVYTMTGGGPGTSTTMTPMVYLYMYGFKYSKVSYSMAIGVIIMAIALLLILVTKRFITDEDSKMY